MNGLIYQYLNLYTETIFSVLFFNTVVLKTQMLLLLFLLHIFYFLCFKSAQRSILVHLYSMCLKVNTIPKIKKRTFAQYIFSSRDYCVMRSSEPSSDTHLNGFSNFTHQRSQLKHITKEMLTLVQADGFASVKVLKFSAAVSTTVQMVQFLLSD